MSDQLREAVEESGRTNHDLAVSSGIDPTSFGRFMKLEREWSLATADRLCAELGLSLAGGGKRAKGTRGPGRAAPAIAGRIAEADGGGGLDNGAAEGVEAA